MYRTTPKKSAINAKCKAMRAAKAAKAAERAARVGPRQPLFEPPECRRTVVVMDHDFVETRVDVFELQKTNRIDTYVIVHNGTAIAKGRMGWARFCKRLSVHYPRLLSPYSREL